MTNSSGSYNYAYDPYGYRILKSDGLNSRQYLLESEHLESVYDELTEKYLRGVVVDELVNGYEYDVPNDDKTRTNINFHHNNNGSVVGASSHIGGELETISYDAFGALIDSTGSSNNKLRYTAREHDVETGLYYYRARYYDPELGRFLSEDPLGFEAGINFYSYVNNNPLKYSDPFGLDAFTLGASGRILGTRLGGKGFVSGVPFLPQVSEENFDIGIEINLAPGMLADLITEMTGDESKPQFSHGLSRTGLTLDAGKTFTPRDSMFDASFDLGGGAKVYGAQVSKNLTGKTNLGLMPDAFEINVGPQFGAGADMTLNLSLSIGDVFTGIFHTIDYAKEKIVTPLTDSYNNYFSPTSVSSGAAGGFVLYPSKSNTNALQRVYKK